MFASSANVSALTLTPLADSTFNDRVTLLMRRFSSLTFKILIR